MTCQHCGTNFEGNFCPVCGRPRAADASSPVQPQYPPVQPSDSSEYYHQPITKMWWFWMLIAVTIISLFITSQLLAPGQSSGVDRIEETQTIEQQAESAEEPATQNDSAYVPPANDEISNPFGSASSGTLPSIQETVLLDQAGIRVTATGLSESEWIGPEINVLIENDTDQSVTLQTLNVSINGIMYSPVFFCEVAAGKKSNEVISFYQSDLDSYGITSIQSIELTVEAMDSSSWETLVTGDVITLTTDAPRETQALDDSGIPALDQNGLQIVVRGVNTDDGLWGPEVMLYLSNQTGRDITVQADDFSVNGYMITPILSCNVIDGKVAYSTIYLDAEELEKNGIDQIDTIECTFVVCDPNTWDTIFESGPVTIQIPN